jgi:hypothetical protein
MIRGAGEILVKPTPKNGAQICETVMNEWKANLTKCFIKH